MGNERAIKAGAIMALGENFGKDLSSTLGEMWLRLLEPYSAEEVQYAVRRILETYEYKTLPPFAELKKFLPERGMPLALADPEKAKKIKAESEWTWLSDAIGRYGYYNEPKIEHPTTEYVLNSMGGWGLACKWLESELHWKKKEFIEQWLEADGNIELLNLGATAIEERRAQYTLAEHTPRKIGGRNGFLKKLEAGRSA